MEPHAESAPKKAGTPAPEQPPFWHYDQYPLPTRPGHRYPRGRFQALREDLLASGTLAPGQLHPAQPAPWELLALAHEPAYLSAVREGTLSRAAIREIGLPWSEDLVLRARACVQATREAAWAALHPQGGGVAGVLGGGTHHAFPGRGAGYCLFSDIAVAIRELRQRGVGGAFMIVDLDVHQGNGNAEIFANDPTVFTFSAHGAKNWPYRKSTSDLDLELPDGMEDDAYLAAVEPALVGALERERPTLVFYQAGADPLHSDRLGRLALTEQGLHARDRMVLRHLRAHGAAVVVTLGGGYGRDPADTIAVHRNTIRACLEVAP